MTNGQVPPPIPQDARSQVTGPATGLLVTGIIGGIIYLIFLVLHTVGAGISSIPMDRIPQRFVGNYAGVGIAALCFVGLLIAAFIIFVSFKMKQLEEWSLGIAASVLAMIPCISPCCIIGLPIGIWCLVVLNKPEVRAAFR